MRTKPLSPVLLGLAALLAGLLRAPAQNWTLTTAPAQNWTSIASSADGSILLAAVGGGPIFVSTNYGTDWAQTSADTNTSWSSIAMSSDGTVGYAVDSQDGLVFASTNSAADWFQTSVPTNNWSSIVCSSDGSKVVAVDSSDGLIFTSSDTGTTWRQTSAPVVAWTFVCSSADGTRLAGGVYGGYIYASTNSGATWRQTAAPNGAWVGIACSADGEKLVAANATDQRLYVSANGGANWSAPNQPLQNWSYVASSADGALLEAVAFGGPIYTSANSGGSWTAANAPSESWISVCSASDGSVLAAAVSGGGIYVILGTTPFVSHSPTNEIVVGGSPINLTVGASGAPPLSYQWYFDSRPLPGATNAALALSNATPADSGSYFAVVTNDFGSVRSGAATISIAPAFLQTLPATAVSNGNAQLNCSVTAGTNPTAVWFEWGLNGTFINRTGPVQVTNALAGIKIAAVLTNLDESTSYSFQAVCSNALGTVPGGAASFTTTGPAFNRANVPSFEWSSLALSADGSKLAACSLNGLVYTSTNAGATWRQSTVTNTPWQAMAGSADGERLFLAASKGRIYSSTNAGVSWTNTTAPVASWTGLASSADGTKLAASTANSFIYASTNGGAAWSSNSPGPNLAWKALVSSASGEIVVAAENQGFNGNGAVFVSTNFGGSFTNRTPTNGMWQTAACSADGSTIVAAYQYNFGRGGPAFGGPVYQSTDFGATWSKTGSPVTNWTAVACSADGSKLVAADGSGGIHLSRDGGATWVGSLVPVSRVTWSVVASSADGGRLAATGQNAGGIYLSQILTEPELTLERSGANLLFTWPIASTNYVLQQNTGITTTNWTNLTNAPQNIYTNLESRLTIAAPATNRFYRLRVK
jgi:photosystem II stability/assembly factor-like uncharacterized protein